MTSRANARALQAALKDVVKHPEESYVDSLGRGRALDGRIVRAAPYAYTQRLEDARLDE